MQYEILHLPKDQYKGTLIPIAYTTGRYYDVCVAKTDSGLTIRIESKALLEPRTHTPEAYDSPDALYQDHWQHACAWGVVAGGQLVAAV